MSFNPQNGWTNMITTRIGSEQQTPLSHQMLPALLTVVGAGAGSGLPLDAGIRVTVVLVIILIMISAGWL